MFEPEEFLETLDRMIELSLGMLAELKHDEELSFEVETDLLRLRDLHERIRIQFGIDSIVVH